MITKDRKYTELTRDEVRTCITEDSILLFPLGATEQHGSHLPICTDTILASGFSQRIMLKYAEKYDLWLLPTFEYSLSPEHKWANGTLSISIDLFVKLFKELIESLLSSQPARNMLIINGHGGNRGVLETLIQEIRNEYSFTIAVIHPSNLSRISSSSKLCEVHSGKSETSMIMELAPDLISYDKITHNVTEANQIGAKTFIIDRAVTWPWNSNDLGLSSNGIIGDCSSASPELGKRIVDNSVANAEEVIINLIQYGKQIRKDLN